MTNSNIGNNFLTMMPELYIDFNFISESDLTIKISATDSLIDFQHLNSSHISLGCSK